MWPFNKKQEAVVPAPVKPKREPHLEISCEGHCWVMPTFGGKTGLEAVKAVEAALNAAKLDGVSQVETLVRLDDLIIRPKDIRYVVWVNPSH